MKISIPIRRWVILLLIFSLIGCDAFVRKFTRKHKKSDSEREELVLVPQEYKNTMSKEQIYRQYFLFWKCWQDELIEALNNTAALNHKKQVSCAEEALKNLVQLRTLLNSAEQKRLDICIGQLSDLKEAIKQDTYGGNFAMNRWKAEHIKMRILREFSFDKIKKSLV